MIIVISSQVLLFPGQLHPELICHLVTLLTLLSLESALLFHQTSLVFLSPVLSDKSPCILEPHYWATI